METLMKIKNGTIIVILFSICIIDSANAQDESVNKQGGYKIEGIITDSEKHAIPYVNISIKGTSIGTMTNDDGAFTINVSEEFIDDTIVVSHIGYETQYFMPDLQNLIKRNIELKEVMYSLDEVSISPIDAFSIIQKAIIQIPNNYPSTQYESEAFYREVVTENRKYIEYAEGLIAILHNPFDPIEKKEDLIKLIQSRKKKNDIEEYELSRKTSNPIGGPVSCIKYNSIKNHPSFLKPNAMELYNYDLIDIIEHSGREVYIIEFDQNDDVKKSLYKGTIYIDKESLAFIHLNFGKSPKGIGYALPRGFPKAMMKLFSMSMVGTDRKVIVNYKLYYDTWYLSSINYIEVASFIRNEKPYDIVSTKNLVITNINSEIKNLYLKGEVLKSGEFKDQIGEYDEDFWGNYNIIPINIELQNQLKK